MNNILQKIEDHIRNSLKYSKEYMIVNAIIAVAYALVYIGDAIKESSEK